ncbi:P-loop containing nucleoside triphosphate hydrolase protein, partial [Dichotomocladium elegans]
AQPRFANLSNDDVLRIHEKTVHVVPHNKLFTFDHVFGTDSRQSEVFEALGPKLISKFTEGEEDDKHSPPLGAFASPNLFFFDVCVCVCGQTSSGKTYTMGTAQHQAGRYNMEEEGIVPRAMALLFDTLAAAGGSALTSSDRPITPAPSLSNRKYSVRVSFVEIYNEELIDLLNPAPLNERPPVSIREDAKGHIYWAGQGTRNRATGATDMNEKSSRSHAIFSVSLRQEKWVSRGNKASRDGEWMVTTSKFHFVDLAGSERLKRTAAEGERRKEGININAGLLALGNVISALGDPSKRSTHIPYRDSKLTRLLQDSLGGSATTLMIACASPAEYNLSETLNTLQYANRARNIKNRVEKNEVEEWMTSDNIELLRSMIGRLKAEVRNLKSGSLSSTGSTAAAAAAAGAVDHHHNHSLAVIGAGGAGDMDQVFQEQRLVIADLQRQVEELDGEASVTRERNRVVEAELKRLRKLEAINDDFQHLVEPVIEEYEKSIVALESQLAMARAALNHSDIGFEEQRQKLEQCELLLENQDQTVLDLRSRLNKLQEREASNESYIDELEGKLVQSAKDARRDQELLNELKTRIMRFKETDENTEQYIFDLEQRLATSEAERHTIQETLQRNQEQQEQLQRLSIPPPPSPLPRTIQNDQQQQQHERNSAASRRYADEEETPESKNALAVKLAEERLALETAKVTQLSQDLEKLQTAHHELQEVHDELLKENDEVLMRYQEVTD